MSTVEKFSIPNLVSCQALTNPRLPKAMLCCGGQDFVTELWCCHGMDRDSKENQSAREMTAPFRAFLVFPSDFRYLGNCKNPLIQRSIQELIANSIPQAAVRNYAVHAKGCEAELISYMVSIVQFG